MEDGAARKEDLAESVSGITPMLGVADLEESISFYEAIGFRTVSTNQEIEGEEDCELNWAMLELHGHSIMLNAGGQVDESRTDVVLSIGVREVDRWFAALPSGTPVVFAPRDQFYGRRDFTIRDPSGFRLLFGEPIRA